MANFSIDTDTGQVVQTLGRAPKDDPNVQLALALTSSKSTAPAATTLPGEHGTGGGVNPYDNTGDNPTGAPLPNNSGNPTGGGGGTTTTPSPTPGPPTTQLDWRAYLADWGFPPDVVAELDRIFKTYSDTDQAGKAALAYIRGTDWYKVTFAGIGEGIKNGVIGNEADYRSYVNQLNQEYRRYYGRDVNTQEVADFLKKGMGAGAIGQHLAGVGYINANRNDIQYGLGNFMGGQASEAELGALGDQVGGLDNMMGGQLQQRLDKARARIQDVFSGSLATPALALVSGGLTASSLGAKKPDVQA